MESSNSSFRINVVNVENHSEVRPFTAEAPLMAPKLPDVTGQRMQVPGMFQAPQISVIQPPHVQAGQMVAEQAGSTSDIQTGHNILSRRPSYRKILDDLSSDFETFPHFNEDKVKEQALPTAASAPLMSSIYQTSSGKCFVLNQGKAIPLSRPAAEALQVAQNRTMNCPAQLSGASVLHGAMQPRDSLQQFYHQGAHWQHHTATGDMPAYQLRSPNPGLPQNIVMAASTGAMQNPTSQQAEEITRKREVRLMKNREAARECRRKKKEYVKCLENRVAVLENQNKTLIEELKALKDLYCHKAE